MPGVHNIDLHPADLRVRGNGGGNVIRVDPGPVLQHRVPGLSLH